MIGSQLVWILFYDTDKGHLLYQINFCQLLGISHMGKGMAGQIAFLLCSCKLAFPALTTTAIEYFFKRELKKNEFYGH